MKTIHKSEDFEGMRKAGNLAARTLDLLVDHVKPGVSTQELDRIAFNFIVLVSRVILDTGNFCSILNFITFSSYL